MYETHQKFILGLASERLATTHISKLQRPNPLTSTCSAYTVTFNGTIFNHLELRSTLIKYGVVFKAVSDTEVLLECYKKLGRLLFERIDGTF
ncbi:MAG: hypothetical protein EOO42_11765 [Flavobacteriales bacterium]|nr:MAG: hypothetical protein EOO42_11765 [Flavobacteriales bacterium]